MSLYIYVVHEYTVLASFILNFTAVITFFQCAREKSSVVNHLQWARHGDGSALFS
jgi:hypothetical protein